MLEIAAAAKVAAGAAYYYYEISFGRWWFSLEQFWV